MDILSTAGEKLLEPNGTGAFIFRFDCIFWPGLTSVMSTNPVLLKLASVIRTSCFPEMGCFSANSQASLRVLLTESNISFNSNVKLIGICFKQFVEWTKFFRNPEKKLSVKIHESQVLL